MQYFGIEPLPTLKTTTTAFNIISPKYTQPCLVTSNESFSNLNQI